MEKIRTFIKLNLLYLVITIICAVYLVRSLITIEESGKTIHEIIADSSIILLFGIAVTELFKIQGILMGERDEKVLATNELHANTVEGINGSIDLLEDYCSEVTKDTLMKEQIKYLNIAGIKYEEFKNKTYDLSCLDKHEKKIAKRYIMKARRLKLTPLISSELVSDDNNIGDPLNLGKTKKQYMKWSAIKDMLSKVIVAVIFGYYAAKLIQDFSLASLIWTMLQVVIFLVFGLIAMMNSYFFIVDELRNRKIRKIDWLEKFKIWVKKRPVEVKKVEEVKEIEMKKEVINDGEYI